MVQKINKCFKMFQRRTFQDNVAKQDFAQPHPLKKPHPSVSNFPSCFFVHFNDDFFSKFQGRNPSYLEPAIIVTITDNGTLSNTAGVFSEVIRCKNFLISFQLKGEFLLFIAYF